MRTLAIILSGLIVAHARVHHLVISNDERAAFSIESFGFYSGGMAEIRASGISISPPGATHVMGIVMYPTASEASISQEVQAVLNSDECPILNPADDVLVLNMSDPTKWGDPWVPITIEGPGLWDIMFIHCSPYPATVSFTLDATFLNPGGNYLSAGEIPLPIVYGVMTGCFAAVFAVWAWYLRRHIPDIHKIHHLMTLLIFLKILTLLFESLMYHFTNMTGHSTGWNVVFYIATFCRGCVLIACIALIGAGWSLVKPFLSQREKKVLMVAIPIQIINNIGIIIVDELAPGSQTWSAWYNLLHASDIIASLAVVIPIVWSIRTLRVAHASDSADEKTRDTLSRLLQFRSFYISTLAWLYFTRIIVFLLSLSLPFDSAWLAPFFEEVATLAYYVATGYRFRPAADNNDYLRIPADDEDLALRPTALAQGPVVDGEIELSAVSTGGGEDIERGRTSNSSVRAVTTMQTKAKPVRGGDDHDSNNSSDVTSGSSSAIGGGSSVRIGNVTQPTSSSSSSSGNSQRNGMSPGKPGSSSSSSSQHTRIVIGGGGAGGEEDDFGYDDLDDSDIGLGKIRSDAGRSGGHSTAGVPAGVRIDDHHSHPNGSNQRLQHNTSDLDEDAELDDILEGQDGGAGSSAPVASSSVGPSRGLKHVGARQ